MSNVIQFLEAMGRKPALSPADYAASVAALEVDDAQRQALLERDHAGLNELLDGRVKMFCVIATPDERAPNDAPDQDDGYVPGREDEPLSPDDDK